jgi:hypothetical protein
MLRKVSQSAYFPYHRISSSGMEERADETSGISSQSGINNKFDTHYWEERSSSFPVPNGIQFPKNFDVLWDRTVVATPVMLSSKSAIPPLVLDRENVSRLLSHFLPPSSSSPSSTSLQRETVFAVSPVSTLDTQHQQSLSMSHQNQPFALILPVPNRYPTSTSLVSLTVPLFRQDRANLEFDEKSTQ